MLPGEWPGRWSTSKARSPRSTTSPSAQQARRRRRRPGAARRRPARRRGRRRRGAAGCRSRRRDTAPGPPSPYTDGSSVTPPASASSAASAAWTARSANSCIPPMWSLWAWVATASSPLARSCSTRWRSGRSPSDVSTTTSVLRPRTCQTLQRSSGCTWGSASSVMPSPTSRTSNHGSATGRSSTVASVRTRLRRRRSPLRPGSPTCRHRTGPGRSAPASACRRRARPAPARPTPPGRVGRVPTGAWWGRPRRRR